MMLRLNGGWNLYEGPIWRNLRNGRSRSRLQWIFVSLITCQIRVCETDHVSLWTYRVNNRKGIWVNNSSNLSFRYIYIERDKERNKERDRKKIFHPRAIWFPFRIVFKHSLYYQLGRRNVIKYSTLVPIVRNYKETSPATYPRWKLICIFLRSERHPPCTICKIQACVLKYIYISTITRFPLVCAYNTR